MKNPVQATVVEAGHVLYNTDSSGVAAPHVPTPDEMDMARFGKRQRLRRNFGLPSMVALTTTLMVTWEGVLMVLGQGFANGGPLGLFGTFIYAWVGAFSQVLVMAELGSMVPLAGGQYNWVAVLAPSGCSKFLSYMTGWFSMIAWQAATAGTVYLAGTMIQGLAMLNHPDYEPKMWQALLLFYAVIAISILVNTLLAKILPQIETAILIIHLVGFFALLIPLVSLAPKAPASEVFSTWINEGEWPTRGLTFFVGATANVFCFFGVDAASHMAEEIENAARIIPQSMVVSVLLNGAAGLAMLVAVLFCMGDVQSALTTPTGYPYMEIFAQAVQSNRNATGMIVVIIAAMMFGTIGLFAASSRMLWAFAREKAMPGHSWLAKVHKRTMLPLYSIGMCMIINILLALINLGSTAVFNAFTGLSVGAFYSAYLISAGVLLYRRLRTPASALRYGPFSLGRFGIPIIIFSMAYSIVVFFFTFWPQFFHTTASNMNWEVAVYGAVIIACLIYWVAVARHTYTGPIVEITAGDLDFKPRSSR